MFSAVSRFPPIDSKMLGPPYPLVVLGPLAANGGTRLIWLGVLSLPCLLV